MKALALALLFVLCACSSPPPIEPEPPPEPVDAGSSICTTFEPWQHTGRPCDPAAVEPCPLSNNPCMHSLCTNDGLCVLGDPGEGQPGKCGADQWCVYVASGVLGCCAAPPPCIYDAANNCIVSGMCPASHPWCSPDGECCQ